MERQVERVLILVNEPILKRPFAVNLVELALPEACKVDKDLCDRVRQYLDRYSHDYGVSHASLAAAYTHGVNDTVPNSNGESMQKHYDLSARFDVQPKDYVLATAGVVAYIA